ncbi:MAG TPA: fibronectin type III domain-containing protein [Jatrophihabitans sp.]
MRKLLCTCAAVVVAVAMGVLSFPQSASAAQPLSVFVGYLDTHSDPLSSNQPNPWPYTDPNSYIGTPCPNYPNDTTCWDASAVRLDNPNATDVTGVHPVVVIAGSTYDLWGTNVTVRAHSTLVLTETGGQNSENFDGSDFSPNSYNGGNAASCTNSGAIPSVNVTIAGATTSYVDSGQVLNGGGVDSGHCVNGSFVSGRIDESHPWVQIGAGAAAPPSAPRTLSATAGSGSVNLSWTAPSSDGGSAITSYSLYRGTTAGGEASTPVATNVSTNNFTDTGLVNGTKYFYTVAAINSAGPSPRSNEASATPTVTQPTVPSAPRSLAATPASGSVSLSWTAPTANGGSPVTGYNIYRGTTAGGEVATPLASNVTTLSYTDIADTNGSAYFYKVAAVNAVGVSAQSNEASAAPLATVPSAPQGLTASGASGSIALSWSAPLSDGGSGVTGYDIYRGTSGGAESSTPIATNLVLNSFTDTAATNGATYYYQVSAVNNIGTSPRSNEASATAAVSRAGTFTGLSPQRVLDSRTGNGARGPIRAGGSITVKITGRGGVPASGVGAVALTVTVTATTAAGYITVYPTGTARPATSNLNFVAGQTVPNLVITRLATNGSITLFNSSTHPVQLLADISGYYR